MGKEEELDAERDLAIQGLWRPSNPLYDSNAALRKQIDLLKGEQVHPLENVNSLIPKFWAYLSPASADYVHQAWECCAAAG